MLLSLAGIAVLALAGNAVLSALRGPLPTYVQTQTAAAGDISQSLSTTGTLTSGQTVVVPSPVTAPLAEVKVEAGQIVNGLPACHLGYRAAGARLPAGFCRL